MKTRIFVTVLLVFVLSMSVNVTNSTAAEVAPIDLGTLGGTTSYPVDVNNRGKVIGYSQAYDPTTEEFPTHAFLWSGGEMIDIGRDVNALAINDVGQIVGDYLANEYGNSHAFLWERGVRIDLGTLGGSQSGAYDINNSGQIVGQAWTSDEYTHAVLWDKAKVIDLGTLGGDYSVALKINDSGQIIGASTTADGQFHAFLWEDGTMIDITPLGAESSWPLDINNKGQVIGTVNIYIDGNGVGRSFLWEKGQTLDLGSIGGRYSEPRSINENGSIVGLAWDMSDIERAILWQKGELSVIGPTQPTYLVSSATDINDAGQIIGLVYDQQLGIAQPVFWDQSKLYYLEKFQNEWNARAIAINNQGLIIGEYEVEPGIYHACIWNK